MKIMHGFIIGCILVSGLIAAFLVMPSAAALQNGQEALFYQPLENNAVQCKLCPRNCYIAEGKRGFCRARENRRGKLYTLNYAKLVAVHLDPIEKKPLFHFLPGTQAFS